MSLAGGAPGGSVWLQAFSGFDFVWKTITSTSNFLKLDRSTSWSSYVNFYIMIILCEIIGRAGCTIYWIWCCKIYHGLSHIRRRKATCATNSPSSRSCATITTTAFGLKNKVQHCWILLPENPGQARRGENVCWPKFLHCSLPRAFLMPTRSLIRELAPSAATKYLHCRFCTPCTRLKKLREAVSKAFRLQATMIACMFSIVAIGKHSCCSSSSAFLGGQWRLNAAVFGSGCILALAQVKNLWKITENYW